MLHIAFSAFFSILACGSVAFGLLFVWLFFFTRLVDWQLPIAPRLLQFLAILRYLEGSAFHVLGDSLLEGLAPWLPPKGSFLLQALTTWLGVCLILGGDPWEVAMVTLLYLHFAHIHLLIACIPHYWHLPSI